MAACFDIKPILNLILNHFAGMNLQDYASKELDRVTMVKTKTQIELEYAQYLKKELDDLEGKDESKKDITIVCKDKEILVNSAVLKIGSTFFRKILSDGKAGASIRKVTMHELEIDGLEATLRFLFDCKIAIDESDVNQVKSALKTARILEVDLMFTYCWQTMIAKLSDQYYADLWQLGMLYKQNKSVESLIRYVARKYTRATKAPEFGSLSACQLNQLLQHTDLNALMDTIVTSLLNWAKESPSERRADLCNMLLKLDLSEMTNVVLGLVLENELVKNSRELFNIFRPIVCGRLRKTQNQRFFSGNNLICFRKLKKGKSEESTFCIYNIEKETWTQTKRLPVQLDKDTIITFHRDQIFFVNKCTEEDGVLLVQIFSPAFNAITDSGYIKKVVYGPGAAVIKHKLYVVGGSTNAKVVDPSIAVYSYEVQTRMSSEVAALLEPCIEPVVVNIADELLAVGKNKKYPSVLQHYKPVCNQWTKVKTLPETVTNGVILGEKLYLILENQTQFEVFDHMINLWYTEVIKEGPAIVTGIWKLERTGKQEARLLFRGDDFVLSCYSISTGEWDSCRDSVCADDDCLSVHDVVF